MGIPLGTQVMLLNTLIEAGANISVTLPDGNGDDYSIAVSRIAVHPRGYKISYKDTDGDHTQVIGRNYWFEVALRRP